MNYRESLLAVLDGRRAWEGLRGARVLVTGATGLVGGALADLLLLASREYGLKLRLTAAVRNADRARRRFEGADEVEVFPCDLTSPGSLPDADFTVHAASNAHPVAFSTDPVGTMLGNLLGTRALLEKARSGGRLLFLSSGEIYGQGLNRPEGFRETDAGSVDTMNPRACYPESKRAAETLCASYASQYGADTVVARLCYVLGPTVTPESSRADAQFLRKAAAGEDIVLKSEGLPVRSYCYAADAAAALVRILLCGERAQAYNVANRNCVSSIRNYAETLARLAGVRLRFELPEETERRGYSQVTRAVQDPEKLMALGWSPRFSLEEGLSVTLNEVRSRRRSIWSES